MLVIVVTLLYLVAIANSLQQTSTTPAQRSAALIAGWNSAGCQHFYRKGFFATTESQLKCSQKYSLYRCPAFDQSHFDGFLLPPSSAEVDGKWTCQESFQQSVRRTALVDSVSKIIFVNNFEGENLPPGFTSMLKNLIAKYSFVEQDIFEISEDLQKFFVFTFISDPMEHMLRSWVDNNHGRTLETVLALKKDACVLDPHFWTLPMFLHITTKNDNQPLAYNFIGTIENYQTDILYLESILPPPPPLPLPLPGKSFVNRKYPSKEIMDEKVVARTSSNKKDRVQPVNINSDLERKSTLEKRALCSLLKMDYQCFGGYYTVPAVCGYQ